jgi:hypothetical protein
MQLTMSRVLIIGCVFLAGCSSDALSVSLDLSVMGCAATVSGSPSGELGGGGAAAVASDDLVSLSCAGLRGQVSSAARLGFVVPAHAGHFVAQQAQIQVSAPSPGYLNGTCSGGVLTNTAQVGERFRATFSCPQMTAAEETGTSPALSVSISDGAFDVQITAPVF